MDLKISEIINKISLGELNSNSAAEILISFLEIETENKKREEIIKTLDKIHDKYHYKHIENIIISEDDEDTRIAAINTLINNYKTKSFEPLIWAFNNEKSYKCRVALIKALLNLGGKIVREKFLGLISQISIEKYGKEINKYLSENKNLSLKKLADILINYWTIENIREKYDWFQYKLKDGVVSELDLSDVEIKVRWPIYENNIEEIEEIEGLNNLTDLLSLKLANNRIKEIKGLENLVKLEEIDLFNNEIREIKGLDNLRNLKRINLSRNEISDVKGINHLKKLEYLNIRGNKINEPEKYEYEYFFKYF